MEILAESTPLEDIDKGKQSTHYSYFKAKVFKNLAAQAINETLKEAVDR